MRRRLSGGLCGTRSVAAARGANLRTRIRSGGGGVCAASARWCRPCAQRRAAGVGALCGHQHHGAATRGAVASVTDALVTAQRHAAPTGSSCEHQSPDGASVTVEACTRSMVGRSSGGMRQPRGWEAKTLLQTTKRTAAAEAAFAVAPSSASTFTSGEGGVASVPAADAAVAVASSATLRRMYERKEDMRPAVGGTVYRNRIRANLHANAGRGGRSRRGTGDGIHSCIKGGGGGQDRGGGGDRYRRIVGCERGHRREMGSRAATSCQCPDKGQL